VRRSLLVVIVLGAAIAGGSWWWRRDKADRSSEPAPAARPGGARPRVAEPSLPAALGSARTDVVPPSPDDSRRALPPAEPEVNAPAVQAKMAEVHARLQEYLRPCAALAPKPLRPEAEFRFSYRLTIASGQVSMSNVELVWSELGSAEVETCLLEKVTAARWSMSEPDGTTTVEDAFRGSELK